MNINELEDRIKNLMAEFKASGISIDDFVRQKLSTAPQYEGKDAETLIQTLADIDANYADLQQAKEDGLNREDWLRKKINQAAADASAKPEVVGAVVSSVTAALNCEPGAQTEAVPFEGSEAVEMVGALDDALAKATCGRLSKSN